MKSLIPFCAAALSAAVLAQPAVVGDDACPRYAIDVEAFATCDGDRVAAPRPVPSFDARSFDESVLPLNKRTSAARYVDARRAYVLKVNDPQAVILVDVRSSIEIELAGHPQLVDFNVPWREFAQPFAWDVESHGWRMMPNPQFGTEVAEHLRQRGASADTSVLLLCRAGERSARAADELTRLGYRNVYTIVDGFEGDVGADGQRSVNGWKNAGLPWIAWTEGELINRR
jgi:rhodanese-related sulfurtransferase